MKATVSRRSHKPAAPADTREHHVAGQLPNWSRPSQAFRHFDGRLPDWRTAKPAWAPPRDRIRLRVRFLRALRWVGRFALNQIHPDPRERRKIYIYLIVTTWLGMIAIGVLAAHGVHP